MDGKSILTGSPLYAISEPLKMRPSKAAIGLILGLSLAAALSAGPSGFGQDPKESPAAPAAEPRPFGPLAKSLLVPGWGQFAEGRIVEGIAFLGSTVFCLIETFRNNRQGNENYALYKAAAGRDDAVRYRALTERYDRRRNQMLLAGGAVWALNLLDIALIGKTKDRAASAWTIRIGRDEHDAFVVGANHRF